MKVKEEIRRSLMMHPFIHKNKLDVYDHMFLVIGNGYEWKDGELVTCSDNPVNISDLTTGHAIDKIFNSREFSLNIMQSMIKCYITDDEPITDDRAEIISGMIIDRFRNELKNVHELVIQVLPENVEKAEKDMMVIHATDNFELYPICKYSKIMNIPDDIKDDWKEAVREFYEFLMKSDEPIVIKYREDYKEMLDKIDTSKFM